MQSLTRTDDEPEEVSGGALEAVLSRPGVKAVLINDNAGRGVGGLGTHSQGTIGKGSK